MADPASQPGMLKLVFEDNCVVVNDTEEYYFDSIDSLKTVGQLIAFLEGQETFPQDKKVMPFSVKGRKIGSKEAAASTVAFIRIETPEGQTQLLAPWLTFADATPAPAPTPAPVAKAKPAPAPVAEPPAPKAGRPLPSPSVRALPKTPALSADPLDELEAMDPEEAPAPVVTPAPKPVAKKAAAAAKAAPIAPPPDEEIDDDLQELYQDAKMATLRRGATGPTAPPPAAKPSAQAQYSLLFDDESSPTPAAPVAKGGKKAAAKPAGMDDDEYRQQHEEKKRAAEEAKQRAEEEKRAAEEAKRAAEEAKRLADEEKQRKLKEERLRRQEEERKRQEEEDRKREEDKKRKEEERLKKLAKAEAERKRLAEVDEQKQKEAAGILNKLEEQRRRVQEREKEQAIEEQKKKETEDARRQKIEEDKRRREEEAAAAEKKRRDQEGLLKRKLDETAQKRAEDTRRKAAAEEEAMAAIEAEEAEEDRLRKVADDERRRKEKAEKAALRFSSFMKGLAGVPEDEILAEIEDEDKEQNALAEIDRQLAVEKKKTGDKTMAEGGANKKLKYYAKFDRTGGADGRKPRKGGMRQHLKNIEYRAKRAHLHQKLEKDRDAQRKEEDDRKKKEAEVLAKLQRQQERINGLGGRSRISIMLKETMGKGNAQNKAKQLAGNDKALNMLDELETMIEEEEKREKGEFTALKKKMDQKRAGKDLQELGTTKGRGSNAGSISSAAATSTVSAALQTPAPPPKIVEPAREPSPPPMDMGLDELDAMLKQQQSVKEKAQEGTLNRTSAQGASKARATRDESPPAASLAPASSKRMERFSVLLQNLAIEPANFDIPAAAPGEDVDDGALDLLDDLIEPKKSPRERTDSVGFNDPTDEIPAEPAEDDQLAEERARLREEEERLQRMQEEAIRKKKERLSRTSMKIDAARAKMASMDSGGMVPASPRGGDAFMNELAELERQQAEQLRQLQALENGGTLDSPEKNGFDDDLGTNRPPSMPPQVPPTAVAPPAPSQFEDDLPPEEDEEPLTGPIDPARAAADICYTCGIRVDESPDAPEPLRALDRLWHKECWVCYECHMPLLGSRFGADGPFIYCESDYQRKFFCATCGQMITDHESKVQEGRFYHTKCFTERDDKQDTDFKAWMENFSKVRENTGAPPGTSPRGTTAPMPGGAGMTVTSSDMPGMSIETDGGFLPPPRMSMMPPPPPPGGEPPMPPNPRFSEKPLPEKPLPKPPEKTLPSKPPAPAAAPVVGSPIKPGAVTPGQTPLPELTRELSKTISFREGPKVIQSPKDIVALEQPEKYLFQVTLPTAAHGMEAEKAGFTVKIFDVRGNNVIVTRKYKDFRVLYEELSTKHYPKAKVPKVPKLKDKDKVKTEHAVEVESFLNLCGHLNGIWQVPVMRAFINGEDPKKPKNSNEIVIGRPIDFKHVAHMGQATK